jgi:hypothetical protein
LLSNLEFVAGLRRDGPLEYVKLHMLVQDNNFREMPAFVAFGKRFGVDSVYFSRLTNWGTYRPEEYARRAVHHPAHPHHADLLRVLSDEAMRDGIVNLGNLTDLAPGSPAPAPARGPVGRLVEAMI